jgi:hypothetical protein
MVKKAPATAVHVSRKARPASLTIKEAIEAVIAQLGDRVMRPTDLSGTQFVELTTTVPYVDAKGWLNFIGGWHCFSEPGGGAHWVGAIGGAGKLEIWLKGVTPGKNYIVAIETGCIAFGSNPSFEVRSSDASPVWVGALPPFQTLLLLIEPDMDLSLVTVEPQNLDSWSFYKAAVYELP